MTFLKEILLLDKMIKNLIKSAILGAFLLMGMVPAGFRYDFTDPDSREFLSMTTLQGKDIETLRKHLKIERPNFEIDSIEPCEGEESRFTVKTISISCFVEKALGFTEGQMKLAEATLKNYLLKLVPPRKSVTVAEAIEEARRQKELLKQGQPPSEDDPSTKYSHAQIQKLRRILRALADPDFALKVKRRQDEQRALHDLSYKVCESSMIEAKTDDYEIFEIANSKGTLDISAFKDNVSDFKIVQIGGMCFLEYGPQEASKHTIPPLVLVFNGQAAYWETEDKAKEMLNKAQPGTSFSHLDPSSGLHTLVNSLEAAMA